MFGRHYFGGAYFGPRYWGDGGAIVPPISLPIGYPYRMHRGDDLLDKEILPGLAS
jgi:hypothetical protein